MGLFDFLKPKEDRDEAMNRFVLVNIETTGQILNEDRIVRLCMVKQVRAENGQATLDMFSQYFSPSTQELRPMSSRMKIKKSDISEAPEFCSEISNIESFVGNRSVVSVRGSFELAFFKAEYARCGRTFSNPFYDMISTIHKQVPGTSGHDFRSICKKMGIGLSPIHETEDDLIGAYKLFFENGLFRYVGNAS